MAAKRKRPPPEYHAPLRSRRDQAEWLLRHEYYEGYLSWDVKLRDLDFSFEHLLAVFLSTTCYKGEDDVPRQYRDPAWLQEARQILEEHEDDMFEWAVEDARRGLFEYDGYRTLWRGQEFKVEYELRGRSGGHLVMTSFEGSPTTREHLSGVLVGYAGDSDEEIASYWSARSVRELYQFVVQCDHDFSRKQCKAQVEYYAASTLFENLCIDIELEPLVEDMLGTGI